MVVAAKSMLDESREIASSIKVFIFGGRKLIRLSFIYFLDLVNFFSSVSSK
jgi:hypothetical protein